MIRVSIEYRDAATTCEVWPDVYRDREQALRFLNVMHELHGGSITAIWAEVWCEDCGAWELEDEGVCVQCGFQECRETIVDYDGDLVCEDCAEDRDDGWEPDEARRCGVSAFGAI